ncbi:MAG: TlpA family protein disulfide reductase [Bacteroidetes bacterium]|nr:MAG: TlpA family protein disulfide reductase [Bacteroidota bacterium]
MTYRGAWLRGSLGALLVLGLTAGALVACGAAESAPPPVRSYLEGQITVRAEVDSIPDYRGFEVLVASSTSPSADLDTLGYAVTDSTGFFRMDITAPHRGIYAVVIARRGQILKVDEMVVADGDSAQMRLVLPAGQRPIAVRSRENAAWLAFRNTQAQHNQELMKIVQEGAFQEAELRRSIQQTATILWNLQEQYPNTLGGAMAAAQSIITLDDWNDSLLVARMRQIQPDNPRLVDVVRIGRGAVARLAGQDSAIAFVRAYQRQVTEPADWAALQSEIVIAYMDSLQNDRALAAVRELKSTTTDSVWTAWARQAEYELQHLMPGMPAPGFTATTYDGEAVSLEDLRGRLVLLEFYRPELPAFQQELPIRNTLYEVAAPGTFDIVSISLQPDTLLNEAFFEGRAFPGIHIIGPGGPSYDVAERYAVTALPTRILIDPEGRILSKYVGNAIMAVRDDVMTRLGLFEDQAGIDGP